ncbi:MAG: EFR1 family ferrodoxin, partial [Clostridiales bacterium]|nr:EFR1 family ferrodoxin [Clostridiales bacterium]
MKKIIYYFTGTGNSMRAAEKIAMRLKDTEIISMRGNPLETPAANADIIGFVYPVYHWTMPEPAVNFIRELEVNPNAYIFVVAMSSFILGFACEKLEELLKSKGAKIAYGTKVNSVANYAICYPPVPPPKLVVPKTERRLDKIAEDIARKELREIPRAGFIVKKRYKKVMTQYKEMQALADYGFVINEDCKPCGLCEKL